MEKFEDIQNSFKNMRTNFLENVKDRVGASIDNEQLEPCERTLSQMIGVENKVNIEILNINRLLVEARTIIPRV